MATSELTREYWINTIKGWAENRLPGPQYDECCAVLDELMARQPSADEQVAKFRKRDPLDQALNEGNGTYKP